MEELEGYRMKFVSLKCDENCGSYNETTDPPDNQIDFISYFGIELRPNASSDRFVLKRFLIDHFKSCRVVCSFIQLIQKMRTLFSI